MQKHLLPVLPVGPAVAPCLCITKCPSRAQHRGELCSEDFCVFKIQMAWNLSKAKGVNFTCIMGARIPARLCLPANESYCESGSSPNFRSIEV